MAMSGRIRSSIPIFQRILRSGSLSVQRSTLRRTLFCPTFSNPKISRNYVTESAPKQEKIKVPLALSGVSGRYATALFLAAVKQSALDKVESELLDVVEALKKSPTCSQFMKNFSVPRDIRIKVITEICAEAKVSDLTKNFLVVLAENGRLRHLETIVVRFVELTMAHRGEVKAVATTLIPLPEQEEKELKETLQDIIGHGKKVKLEQKIDESILGGLVVEFSQKLFDMSIKTRAEKMERYLREPISTDTEKIKRYLREPINFEMLPLVPRK